LTDVTYFLSRRGLLASAAAVALTGCGRGREAETAQAPQSPESAAKDGVRGTLDWAVAGEWRGPDAQRDVWRHPRETLTFFGLKPGMTVVEVWPGSGGFYTQILAPYLKETGGKLYAANFQTVEGDQSAAGAVVTAYRDMFRQPRNLYGEIEFGAFGPTSPPLAPAGTADLVLFILNVHAWMAAGLAEKAFQDAFAALKPGGALGVEAHRGSTGGPQDPLAADGYVQEAYVKQMAAEAGFRFDTASEVNANAKDTKDYPFGVWTLAPERRSAAPGAPPDPAFDRTRYDAIGESDRMTLRFVKPA
jgi:predicted methyltransferase